MAPAVSSLAAADLLREACDHDRTGQVDRAMQGYDAAIQAAARTKELSIAAEAYRRLGILQHRGNQPTLARSLCEASHDLATQVGDNLLAAQALNALGGIAFETGDLKDARVWFGRALSTGSGFPALVAKVEQNLGILHNVEGDLTTALGHYQRSLQACGRAGDDLGSALAHHNLGMAHSDQRMWESADSHFQTAFALAETVGDRHLQALCLLNHAEVHLARGLYEQAKLSAESALQIFNQLESELDKADAYRMIGTVFRETGRPVLAEARLNTAIEIAQKTDSVLCEAEANRELALLLLEQNRNQDSLARLHRAHRLFARLNAQADAGEVKRKRAELEATYLQVVRTWGASIESADTYTHGHCERVAGYARAIAKELGLSPELQTTIEVGAYLHDVGKVKVPHEIVNKPGPLTDEELEVIKMHPIWGVELLVEVEFPWDIKPIIRWHHERRDGTGYPDQLSGNAVPVTAQVVGLADVFDALTTARSYRPALEPSEALRILAASRSHWNADVYTAFARSFCLTGEERPARQWVVGDVQSSEPGHQAGSLNH